MTRGTRRLAWLAAVFLLAAVPIACSGFSSEETQAPGADGGVTGGSSDGSLEDSGVTHDDAIVSADGGEVPFACTGSETLCADFEAVVGAWPAPFENQSAYSGGVVERIADAATSYKSGASFHARNGNVSVGSPTHSKIELKVYLAKGALANGVRVATSGFAGDALIGFAISSNGVAVEFSKDSKSETNVKISEETWIDLSLDVKWTHGPATFGLAVVTGEVTVTVDGVGPKTSSHDYSAITLPTVPQNIWGLGSLPIVTGSSADVYIDNVRITELR